MEPGGQISKPGHRNILAAPTKISDKPDKVNNRTNKMTKHILYKYDHVLTRVESVECPSTLSKRSLRLIGTLLVLPDGPSNYYLCQYLRIHRIKGSYTNTYTCIRTYMHTYIHTYIHSYIHTLHTYILAYA